MTCNGTARIAIRVHAPKLHAGWLHGYPVGRGAANGCQMPHRIAEVSKVAVFVVSRRLISGLCGMPFVKTGSASHPRCQRFQNMIGPTCSASSRSSTLCWDGIAAQSAHGIACFPVECDRY